ncbi:MAG: family peptidase [Flaviaesturariibacter sp.]|nr:family peptidase [Flaviaesturariibacter sp.]
MKFACLLIASISFGSVLAQLPDQTIRDLKSGRLADDTSYVYELPYQTRHAYLFVQGANSSFSHKNELSYDFKMTPGSVVCAARHGVVVGLRADSDEGGLKPGNLADGNYIIIEHPDGSRAQYWHLQHNGALVSLGDTVMAGQRIGLSGNTGYTAFPHLHFQVLSAEGREVLVRFATKRGTLYLRPGNRYTSVRKA